MKIKLSELKKIINEAIITEKKALLKEGYTQEQLDEIDFAKVGNFFKGTARGVKDMAKDAKKNYFDNSDLNLETDIKRLSKKKEIASQKVADLQKELSTYENQLSKIESDISEKTSQLDKIKKDKGNSKTKETEETPIQSKEEKPEVKKPITSKPRVKKPATSKDKNTPVNKTKKVQAPKSKNEPVDLNKDASTFQKDPNSGQRFRKKLKEENDSNKTVKRVYYQYDKGFDYSDTKNDINLERAFKHLNGKPITYDDVVKYIKSKDNTNQIKIDDNQIKLGNKTYHIEYNN